ncbi:GNAT family N-acetyltransferase [Streptomyces acidiscabies]|uniref:GNAT family N-acetyltransferase n=1 Tax=Streptomyces acidiscabies TaxID=42234 RepID=A0ABU4LWM1_9ACTN|nr:GNAT family N-acetyltransferase [Streptomyces acidiscabies]MDX3020073.1 GNAT family N-acetyltransferase [Streptomyces acidiscabies]
MSDPRQQPAIASGTTTRQPEMQALASREAAGFTADIWVRAPRHGDEETVAVLARAALGEGEDLDAKQFAVDVCTAHGRPQVPYGAGQALVAGLPGSEEPGGIVYMTPPVRLIQESRALGLKAQDILTREMREIELVAVAASVRGFGVGSALLLTAQSVAAQEGVRIMCAKVAARNTSALRWWRHRGYALAQPGEDVRLHLDVPVICNDGRDGYRLVVQAHGGRVSEGRYMLHVHPGGNA